MDATTDRDARRDGPGTAAATEQAGPAATPAAAAASEDSAKRREILEGARQVFRAQGFDGASMGEIAKAAGVSKGTLYVYFDNKVALFETLVETDRHETAERLFMLDEADPDVRAVLYRLGLSFVAMMTRPEQLAFVRMVVGVADKFPSVGQRFFAAGPMHGNRRLAAYLAKQVAAGRLAIADTERAAEQFLNLCHGRCAKALLFAAGGPPTAEEVEAMVSSAVEVFFAAYGPKGAGAA